MIIALFKLISPFHSSEKAWMDAKNKGLPPYLQANVIGTICIFAAGVAAVFGYTIAQDQVKVISDNLYNVLNGIAALYGVAMVISHSVFKKKSLTDSVKANAFRPTQTTSVSEPVAPDKVEPTNQTAGQTAEKFMDKTTEAND